MSEVRHGLFGHDRTGRGFRDDLLGHDRELKSKWEEIQWMLLPREELQRYVSSPNTTDSAYYYMQRHRLWIDLCMRPPDVGPQDL